MKNVGLIFDSSYQIGGGHFWRCFNLAKALNNKKKNFFFISNKLHINFINLLKKEKFNYIKIHRIENFSLIKKVIEKKKLDVIISDYYGFNSEIKKKIKKLVNKLIVIDDHLDKKHNCDVFINNNFMSHYSKNMIKKLNPNTILFLGEKYFIHNKNFFKIKKKGKQKIRKVFVFFGSSDPSNETLKFIQAVENFNYLKFIILIGKLNKKISQIRSYCKNKKNIKIFYNVSNNSVLRIMQNTNFAFGSGGINLTERLYLGIPSIAVCTAWNQRDALIALKRKKIIHYFGSSKKMSISKIKQCMNEFINNKKRYLTLSKNISRYYKKQNKFYMMIRKLNLIID